MIFHDLGGSLGEGPWERPGSFETVHREKLLGLGYYDVVGKDPVFLHNNPARSYEGRVVVWQGGEGVAWMCVRCSDLFPTPRR